MNASTSGEASCRRPCFKLQVASAAESCATTARQHARPPLGMRGLGRRHAAAHAALPARGPLPPCRAYCYGGVKVSCPKGTACTGEKGPDCCEPIEPDHPEEPEHPDDGCRGDDCHPSPPAPCHGDDCHPSPPAPCHGDDCHPSPRAPCHGDDCHPSPPAPCHGDDCHPSRPAPCHDCDKPRHPDNPLHPANPCNRGDWKCLDEK